MQCRKHGSTRGVFLIPLQFPLSERFNQSTRQRSDTVYGLLPTIPSRAWCFSGQKQKGGYPCVSTPVNRIVIKKSAVKELESITKEALRIAAKRIQSLADALRPAGTKKLSRQERYRLCHSYYRILYFVHDENRIVRIVKIGHRW